jgi:hypothetical protein
MATNYSDYLTNDKIKSIICAWNFFNELKVLAFVLNPLCKIILELERRTADLSDCYLGLARISYAIKRLPQQFNSEFRNYCIEKINERFEEFDDDNYLLTFFLNPSFRGNYFFLFILLYNIKKNTNI